MPILLKMQSLMLSGTCLTKVETLSQVRKETPWHAPLLLSLCSSHIHLFPLILPLLFSDILLFPKYFCSSASPPSPFLLHASFSPPCISLGLALNFILENCFKPESGSREGLPKIGILITDGKSQDDVIPPAESLRNAGIELFAIGKNKNTC